MLLYDDSRIYYPILSYPIPSHPILYYTLLYYTLLYSTLLDYANNFEASRVEAVQFKARGCWTAEELRSSWPTQRMQRVLRLMPAGRSLVEGSSSCAPEADLRPILVEPWKDNKICLWPQLPPLQGARSLHERVV